MASTHNSDRKPIKGELCGGEGGSGSSDWDYRPENEIVEITIRYGDAIDSLQFNQEAENKFGGHKGSKLLTIPINWPNEYLTKISGYMVTYCQQEVIGALYFTTNRNKKYEAVGTGRKDCKPDFELVREQNRAIVGFFGRYGNYMESIGVYYKDPPAPIERAKLNSAMTLEKDLPREVGPWGGNRDKAWDDGRLQGRIIEIDVHVGNGMIRGIHYRYESEDSCASSPVVLSNKHGGDGATTIYRIELEKDNTDHKHKNKNKCSLEELVGISGFYGAFDGNSKGEYQVVRSISFYTNKGKYGPFGTESGTFFNSPLDAKVVGFHGRSGKCLDAIGVHVEY